MVVAGALLELLSLMKLGGERAIHHIRRGCSRKCLPPPDEDRIGKSIILIDGRGRAGSIQREVFSYIGLLAGVKPVLNSLSTANAPRSMYAAASPRV